MSHPVEYVGTLDEIEVKGRRVRVARVALGLLPGYGLVTARSAAELRAGEVYRLADDGKPTLELDSVFYTRARTGHAARFWVHELRDTVARLYLGGLVVFGPSSAHVCPSPPGAFICGG